MEDIEGDGFGIPCGMGFRNWNHFNHIPFGHGPALLRLFPIEQHLSVADPALQAGPGVLWKQSGKGLIKSFTGKIFRNYCGKFIGLHTRDQGPQMSIIGMIQSFATEGRLL